MKQIQLRLLPIDDALQSRQHGSRVAVRLLQIDHDQRIRQWPRGARIPTRRASQVPRFPQPG